MLPGTSRTFLHSVPGQKIVCHSNVATHEKTSKAAASEFLLKDNTSFLFAVFLQLGLVLERFFPSSSERTTLCPFSNAWSSNLLDYLTTLALIQSNNGVPNWGPNHATKHTVELLNQSGFPSSYITLLAGPEIQDNCRNAPNVESISLSRSYVCTTGPGLACWRTKSCWYCLFMTDFSHSCSEGEGFSVWEGEIYQYQLLQCLSEVKLEMETTRSSSAKDATVTFGCEGVNSMQTNWEQLVWTSAVIFSPSVLHQ